MSVVDEVPGLGEGGCNRWVLYGGAALADDRLTAAEVADLNLFLEGGPPVAGPAPAPVATVVGHRD